MYTTIEGKSPVREFIDSLEQSAKAKVRHAIYLLKEFGVITRSDHIKKVAGTKLWELRVVGGDNIRIFYVAQTGKIFLLLHGFKKKKQKTPLKEILIALERLKEDKSRK